MSFKGWPHSKNEYKTKKHVKSIAPLIISASRATDIPAFYPEWFFNRLQKGHLTWVNPFNGKSTLVSFENARMIVFWTKNPAPILPYLDILDKRNIGYYFLFTLNDYEKENFEPNVPSLEKRIQTFRELSEKIGKERVIWRFDPIIRTLELKLPEITARIQNIGDQIHSFTNKLVFSFIQIAPYKKVQKKLVNETPYFHEGSVTDWEFSPDQKAKMAENLSVISEKWDIKLATCAEDIDLHKFNILPNKCIDADLMRRIAPGDKKLMHFLETGSTEFVSQQSIFPKKQNVSLKDKGQRPACRCIYSKDIGKYNTCPHLCAYCYGNSTAQSVIKNYKNHKPEQSSII